MDIRQLEYFVSIAEEGTFTRAAQRCHVAQSALSHQVARLETELGTRLFVRTSRSVRLSEAGETLLPHARRVLRDMVDARAALDGLAGIVRGRLRVGMTQTANRALDLITVIGEIHRRYPKVTLATATGPGPDLIDAVQNGHLDIALAALTSVGPPPEVTFSQLIDSEPLVAVVPANHPLSRRKRVRIADLANYGFVEFRAGTSLRDMVDNAFAHAGIERTSNFEVGQITDMVHYVGNGLGIAIVPSVFSGAGSTVIRSPKQVKVLQLVDPSLSLTIGAYRRAEQLSSIIDVFLGLLTHGRGSDWLPTL
jgi:DNA-binding transcriptional LysR family regulator